MGSLIRSDKYACMHGESSQILLTLNRPHSTVALPPCRIEFDLSSIKLRHLIQTSSLIVPHLFHKKLSCSMLANAASGHA